MAKFNFNFTLKGVDGNPIIVNNNEVTANKILAQQLFQSVDGDAIKQTEWAFKLYNGEDLLLDTSDTDTLKSIINKPNGFVAGIRYQLLNAFKEELKSNKVKGA